MSRVELLRHHGVEPVIVFDGGRLPMKADEEDTRRRCGAQARPGAPGVARDCGSLPAEAAGASGAGWPLKQPCRLRRARQENKQKAAQHLQAGNLSAAYECYQRAVDVTPAMAKHLIEVRTGPGRPPTAPALPGRAAQRSATLPPTPQVLKTAAVQFIVAPYEADAQMAYLARRGDVHAVITEDSDLLVYGCPRVRRAGTRGWMLEVAHRGAGLVVLWGRQCWRCLHQAAWLV
jgi:exonuclease-1